MPKDWRIDIPLSLLHLFWMKTYKRIFKLAILCPAMKRMGDKYASNYTWTFMKLWMQNRNIRNCDLKKNSCLLLHFFFVRISADKITEYKIIHMWYIYSEIQLLPREHNTTHITLYSETNSKEKSCNGKFQSHTVSILQKELIRNDIYVYAHEK